MKFWKKFIERTHGQRAQGDIQIDIPVQPKPVYEWKSGQEKVIPSFCLLVVNKQCNFHCTMCNMWKHTENPDSLTLNEMKAFVRDLRSFVDEPIFIHVIGGETLLWPHTVEILKYIVDTGFRTSITTNGWFIDADMARKLVDTGMSGIFISLDSLKEETHDSIRGMKGAYRRVMNAIEYLDMFKKENNPELCVGITNTIMERNLGEMIPIAQWAQANEKINQLFYNAVLLPFDGDYTQKDWYRQPRFKNIWPQDYGALRSALKELAELKKSGYKISNPPEQMTVIQEYFRDPYHFVQNMKIKCPRGDLALEVNSVGDLALCFDMPPIGNIRKDNIKDIWFSDKLTKARHAINTCKKECDVVVNCFYKIENITDYVDSDRMRAEAVLQHEKEEKEKKYAPPKTCLLTVSNKCDLRCKMCDLWHKKTDCDDNSIDDLLRFANGLQNFGGDPVEVHLIGGEPLIKEGIFDLIETLRKKDARVVVTTSAYPIDAAMAKRMKDVDLSMINFSLDSLNPEVHDFLRGREGTHAKVLSAIDYVSRFSPRTNIAINTIILKQNMRELVQMAHWVDSDERIVSHYFMAVMRPFGSNLDLNWYQTERAKLLFPDDYRAVEEQLNTLIQMKRAGKTKIENSIKHLEVFKSYFKEPTKFIKHYGCNLHDYAINVNATGDAYLCFFMEKLGNIKEKTPQELWYSAEAEQVRTKMRTCKNNCELIFNCYYEDEK
jgi:MoaA/NifB/PqqE/SkfB family radical SAM enzyme